MKQTKQYCPTCQKETVHIPKLGLMLQGKRLCEVCRTVNKNETYGGEK